ncbi:TIGR04283 family arsenosugar biosynthesis glycosyltransferase [Lignipirellula cremea]|nr:TIGR04283 family arsenosugar biosynthesis glycosyltransferase [Lignipirellula cremea]
MKIAVSVIIPTWNEEAGVVLAIERAWSAGADEVIVADGGSQDETCTLAGQSDCRLVTSPAGRARQQNAGAMAASGRVLLFQHADNWLAAGAIDQVREAIAGGAECGAFCQRIEAAGLLYRLLEWGNGRRVAWRGSPYGDQSIFVERTAFEAVGRFPEVPLLEDLLLMRQLRRRSRPRLLPGPLHVNARRWQKYGVLRQTLRNWRLLAAHRWGASPDQLASAYPRHDQ